MSKSTSRTCDWNQLSLLQNFVSRRLAIVQQGDVQSRWYLCLVLANKWTWLSSRSHAVIGRSGDSPDEDQRLWWGATKAGDCSRCSMFRIVNVYMMCDVTRTASPMVAFTAVAFPPIRSPKQSAAASWICMPCEHTLHSCLNSRIKPWICVVGFLTGLNSEAQHGLNFQVSICTSSFDGSRKLLATKHC